MTYSSLSEKFETECTLERYFRNLDIEDKFVELSDDKLITRLIRKLARALSSLVPRIDEAELRVLKKAPLLLEN